MILQEWHGYGLWSISRLWLSRGWIKRMLTNKIESSQGFSYVVNLVLFSYFRPTAWTKQRYLLCNIRFILCIFSFIAIFSKLEELIITFYFYNRHEYLLKMACLEAAYVETTPCLLYLDPRYLLKITQAALKAVICLRLRAIKSTTTLEIEHYNVGKQSQVNVVTIS